MVTERKRGPQRSETSRQAILAAAAALFKQHGHDHLTIEGIAAEAHVGKQTIYRWWASKSEIIAECLAEGLLLPDWFAPDNTGDLRADLVVWLNNIIDFIHLPGNAGLLRSIVALAADNAEVADSLNDRLGLWRVLGARLGEDSTETGEALIGALVIRSLRGGPLDRDFAERLVATVIR